MQIYFEKDADYDVYKRDYYPCLIRNGFPWQLFPDLRLYLDMKYPEQGDSYMERLEHYRPDLLVISAKMITLDEWTAAGNDAASYWRLVQLKPSSLPHEIMHHIHYNYFGADGSPAWIKAAALTGITLDFAGSAAGSYVYKPAHEAIANYFEACIEGRITNEPFLQFIRGLIGVKFVRLKIGSQEYQANGLTRTMDIAPMIKDGRTLTPPRFTHEPFGHIVEYLQDTQEVAIASI